MSIQKQMKRSHPTVTVDPVQEAAKSLTKFTDPPEVTTLTQGQDATLPHGTQHFRPGYRSDNVWHTYNSQCLPDNREKWEALTVVEKTHWGYYTWPK